MNAEFIDRLAQGLSAMGVPYRAPMLETLARFQEKLLAANARMNLTRVGAEACEAVDRNYLDSLAPLAQGLLQGAKAALDVGSGAGFPGIPLCVLAGEETRFVLVDSLGKRVAFLNEAIAELRLNAEAVHARMEDFARANRERFDVATARAVAPVGVLAELALPALKRSGRLIAYKGPSAAEEVAAAQNALRTLGGASAQILPAPIPGRDWAHTLVIVQKAQKTPAQYPRKAGEPSRNPL